MLQWLRLMLWLLLIAAVSGKEVECDEVDNYNYCWNSQTYLFVDCWRCTIKNQRITQNEVITISPKLANGTIVDVGFVKFDGGDVAKMIKVINKSKSKQILQVILKGTNTRVLNSAFFGNTAQSLKLFWSNGNNDLSVEAYAFQNCATLEVLDLDYNGITSIPPNTFFGLDKLIRLDLRSNQLSEINENSFSGLHNLELLILNQNQLEEISGASFDQLHKLKELHLHENKIEIITKRMFQNNQQLQIVDLNKNQIKIIQSGAFANLKKLTELYLNRNKCINNYFEKKSSEEISAALTACLPIDSTACLIPVILNGYIVNTEDNAIQTVGDSIEDFESMQVICHPTYQMFQTKAKPTAVGCFDQKWQDQWPQCHSKLLSSF